MTVLHWTVRLGLLAVVATMCWASGDLAPLFGFVIGAVAVLVEVEARRRP